MPLRPLRLGDIYDAAFKIIRRNPRATVGSALLVACATMGVPVVVTLLLSLTSELSLPVALDPTATPGDLADSSGLLGSYGPLLGGALLQMIGLIFVTGMVAHVTMAATTGRTLSLGDAWAKTAGRRLRLVGFVLLTTAAWLLALGAYVALWVVLVIVSGDVVVLVLWGLVSVPAFIALAVWVWVRVTYVAVPAMMLERTGVLAAFGRSFRLTRAQFWRTFGIALLTSLITQVAGVILAFPVAIVTNVLLFLPAVDGYQVLVLVVGQALSTIITTAFVSPFSAAVASLQYVDQRMRKEGFDVELMSGAGAPPVHGHR